MGHLHLKLTLLGYPTLCVAHSTAAKNHSSVKEQRSYYDELGITRDATTEEIKTAFRISAKECHPDTLDTSTLSQAEIDVQTARFHRLKEALTVLTTDLLRRQYDRKLEEGTILEAVEPYEMQSEEDHRSHLADATRRGSQFVEKDTNKISQWYVGQKGMSKEQEFFYRRIEKQEKQQAMRESMSNVRKKIKPLSRTRSLLWLGAPFAVVGMWFYNFSMSSL